MNSAPQFDAGIPLLTEILHLDAADAQHADARVSSDHGEIPAPAPAGSSDQDKIHQDAPADSSNDASAKASIGNKLADVDAPPWVDGSTYAWDALEQRLSTRILQQMQQHVNLVLEQRIEETLAAALHHAAQDLSAHIRQDLHASTAEIVARAVAEEFLKAHKE
ncbi:MAG: hypothetical protein ACI83P_002119 [Janthinobacterium sp.]|jgi:hypothetical protein